MLRYALVFLAFGQTAVADEWQDLSGPEIQDALSGVTLDYGSASQRFSPSGETTYISGRPSLGRWEVRADQFCSVWPPSDHWVCYHMAAKQGVLRFVSPTGEVTDGIIQR